MRGVLPPKNRVIFWRVGSLLYRLPPPGECHRNPSVSVYQLVFLWEAAFSFSESFEDSFSAFAHFMMGDLWAHLSTRRWVFSSFWPETAWLLCLMLPIYLILLWVTFFLLFSQMKKVLKGKQFASVEEVKQQTAESLKGIKINMFKNCFEQWGKHLNSVLYQIESTLKVTEVSTCKNKYTIFYK